MACLGLQGLAPTTIKTYLSGVRQMQIAKGYPNKLTTPVPPPSGAERGGTTAQHTGSLSKAAPPDHSQHPQEDALCLGGHKAGQRKDVVGGGPDGLLRVLQIRRSDSHGRGSTTLQYIYCTGTLSAIRCQYCCRGRRLTKPVEE